MIARLVCAALLLCCLSVRAEAAVLIVTSPNATGPGTLGAAISAAAAGDTIAFALPTPGPITLGDTSDGELEIGIYKDLTIASEVGVAIQLRKSLAIEGNVTLRGLELSPAPDAPPVHAIVGYSGTITVSRCWVHDFRSVYDGGAIQTFGPLTIDASRFEGNETTEDAVYGWATDGGAIFALPPAKVTITRSAFFDNHAVRGGAIYYGRNLSDATQGGLLEIADSTFSGNSATTIGSTSGIGGAIALSGPEVLQLDSVTVFDNESSNGEAISRVDGASVVITRNSLFAGGSGTALLGPGLTVYSLGHNLLGDGSRTLTGAGDLNDTSPGAGSRVGDVIQFPDTSPIVDAGDCSAALAGIEVDATVDQLFQPRTQGGACDIGAWERPAPGPAGPAGEDGADGKDGANGADGKDGTNGADGQDGTNGADGQDGTNGADGHDALVTVSAVPAGDDCPQGGQRIDTGVDDGAGDGTADDGLLQPGEVRQHSFVCAPAPAARGCSATPGAPSARPLALLLVLLPLALWRGRSRTRRAGLSTR